MLIAVFSWSDSRIYFFILNFSGIYSPFFRPFSPFSLHFLSISHIPTGLDIIIPGVLYKLYAIASKTCCVWVR